MRADFLATLESHLRANRSIVLCTVLTGPFAGAQVLSTPEQPVLLSDMADVALRDACIPIALAQLAAGTHAVHTIAGVEVFVEAYPPPPTVIMVGAVHISLELTHLAKQLGFSTVVVDARAAFATAERFGSADELINAWPDEALQGRLHPNAAVVVLTHDPKLDDPALVVALGSDVRYIGALGSKKTHAARVERLQTAGFSPADISRIHAPIGLDIGGRTPAEIALSIMAQIVAVWNNKIP